MKGRCGCILGLTAGLIGLAVPLLGATDSSLLTADVSARTNRLTPLVKAVHAVLPSVVSLSTERVMRQAQSPWGDEDPFFADQQPLPSKSVSLGSGFLIDESGLILTNAHVIRNASRIVVTTYSGKSYEAREVAEDLQMDIALLRICHLRSDYQFPPVRLGRSNDILLGETLISMGNPYGLGNSVATGVVSGIGRKAVYKKKIIFSDIVQLNIALNPGNSGGPLVNLDGETIGMTMSSFKGAEGISFGIPLAQIRAILAKWLIPENAGEVGLGILPEIDPEDETVLIVRQLIEGSPAALAGFRVGDRIVGINGVRIRNTIDAGRMLYKLRTNEELSFMLSDGQMLVLSTETVPLKNGRSLALSLLGIGIQPLSKPLSQALRYPFSQGVVVSRITRKGLDLVRGDMILRVNNVPIASSRDIARALRSVPMGAMIAVETCSITLGGNGDAILSRKILHIPVGG